MIALLIHSIAVSYTHLDVYKRQGKDGGTILYNGEEINVTTPKEAQNLGISIIHQELNLMPDLTAAQNIFIGREATKLGGLYLSESKQNRAAKSLFELLNLDLDPKTKVRDVTVAKQQMIEIAKALSFNSKILIMDEPTAALTESEIRELFKIIAGLKEQGVGLSLIHISVSFSFSCLPFFSIFKIIISQPKQIVNTRGKSG